MSAPIFELNDNFDAAAANTAKWSPFVNNTTVAQVGGYLTFVTTTLTGYAGYDSTISYDLTNSRSVMKVVNAGNQSLASLEVVPMKLLLDANNVLFWYINSNIIAAYKKVASVQTQIINTTYNASVHVWVQIRETAGTVFFEYSPDGLTWTTFTSLADPFALLPLQIEPSVGCFAVEASGTTVQMDNYNLPPPLHQINRTLRPRPFAPGRAR